MNIHALARLALSQVRKNTPLILTASAVVGVVSTAVLAAKASPRAWEKYEDVDEFGTVAYFKASWKVYLPTLASAAVTVATIIMIHKAHTMKYSALMGLYVVGDKAYQELRESIDEVADDNTKELIKERTLKKAINREPEALAEAANEISHASLCYDMYSGRLFRSDLETIRQAENEFNKQLIHHMYGSLNEFYSLIGIEGIGAGEDTGWNSDQLMSIGYNSILTEQGVPAISIDFHDAPPFFNYHSTK